MQETIGACWWNQRAYDILLGRSPFSYSVGVRLPWMEKRIYDLAHLSESAVTFKCFILQFSHLLKEKEMNTPTIICSKR